MAQETGREQQLMGVGKGGAYDYFDRGGVSQVYFDRGRVIGEVVEC